MEEQRACVLESLTRLVRRAGRHHSACAQQCASSVFSGQHLVCFPWQCINSSRPTNCSIDTSVAVNALGKPLAFASAPYVTTHPHPGWAEQQPEDWWSALGAAVRDAVAQAGVSAGEIAALCLDTTNCTVVALDAGTQQPCGAALLSYCCMHARAITCRAHARAKYRSTCTRTCLHAPALSTDHSPHTRRRTSRLHC
jgi:FGGY family of carbohydrate kinases, N-terminal domain